MDSASGDERRWDTLADLLPDIDNVPEEFVVFVPPGQPVGAQTPIELVDEEEVDDNPPEGMRYLLEVPIIKEVLKVWSSWRGGRTPTVDEAAEAVAHYAEYDAYLPEN